MSTLYELDKELQEVLLYGFNENCIDLETGAIDQEKVGAYLESLQVERKTKIENIALMIKNLESDAAEIKAEEKALKSRREAKENKADSLREYIKSSMLLLEEKKFETARVAMSFRTSKTVVVDDMATLGEKYIKVEYSPDKTAIKKAIESGETVCGAHIQENHNLQIK